MRKFLDKLPGVKPAANGGIATLTAVFELAAEKHPYRTALGTGSWQPTCEELNATAPSENRLKFSSNPAASEVSNRLAHALLRRPLHQECCGGKSESPVR